MPLQATSGAASYDAFGGGVAAVPQYIEDVFSTYLYTGNGSTQTITNGIDESGKGAMTWIKCRSDATSHALYDTERGAGRILTTNTTGAQTTSGSGRGLSSFNSTGFSLDDDSFSGRTNQSGSTYASWTFRKQPKFFDVVTYTGDGTNNRTVAHNLTSTPGCIIVKRTDSTGTWYVYHRSTGLANFLVLNTTAAAAGAPAVWDGAPTSTTFTIQDATTNINGASYVAYLFAHNAGGFGLTGTDNVISCGSFTCPSSGGVDVNLGYEPQWILTKKVNGAENWNLWDTMRGWAQLNQAFLAPNNSNAEVPFSGVDYFFPTATGFRLNSSFGLIGDYIYIAIRRGPMKVPTSGTSVFNTALRTTGNPNFVAGFPIDMSIYAYRPGATGTPLTISRLTNKILVTNETSAEVANDPSLNYDQQLGYGSGQSTNSNVLSWMWRRAPSFFDEVCYTGTGTAQNITHNLGVVPELIIAKSRSGAFHWTVYSSTLGNSYPLFLNGNSDGTANYGALMWGSTAPTTTQFPVGTYTGTNSNGQTYVAYLFATCAGVSKCFSYTGNGSSQTINCGFTVGARWVLIKRTDSTGDWYVWDSARGIVSGNDPHLSLNTTAAEVTTDDTIDTDSTGFVVNQVSATNVNVSSATYIGIAIA